MSLTVEIRLPGLTSGIAIELDREADLAGVPLQFVPPKPATRWRRAREAHVSLEDLREDPSLASETLDHPDGYPQSPEVRAWLRRALFFLAEHAPERRFSFRAGWSDYPSRGTAAIEVNSFFELLERGALRSDATYDVTKAEETPYLHQPGLS